MPETPGAKPAQSKGADAAAISKMNQPIDMDADYRISGAAIAELYRLIDEVPMKYARTMLPVVAMNIEVIKDSKD